MIENRAQPRGWFRPAVLLLGLFLVAFLFLADSRLPQGDGLIKVQGVDEVVYYGTSHSLLFDRDVDLSNEYDRLRTDRSLGREWFAIVPETGLPRSAYALGVSLLEIPFLAAGHAVDLATGGPGDGYSHSCIAACFVGVIVFGCVGLLFAERFLRALAEEVGASRGQAALWGGLVALLLWPGTTLFYYSFMLLSQTASFMATALFLLAYWRARGTDSPWRWAAAGAAAGLMTLCRWQDVLFVTTAVVDELWARARQFEPREGWPRWLACRGSASVAAIVVFLPQMFVWKILFGRFMTVPQGGDFFSFPPPHLGQVLFSSLNGWFTWTPLAALGVVGLLMGTRRRPAVAVAFLVPIGLQWVLLSSLRDVWHGGFFGARNMTSCGVLVGAGLVWLVFATPAVGRAAILAGGTLCVAYTLAFAVQYRLELLPRRERLTAQEMLWDKVHLYQAVRRHRAAAACEEEMESDPRNAVAAIEKAIAGFGADRQLLRLLADARERAGDLEGQRLAQDQLQHMLASRLF
jgi:hypothetical protein